MPRWENDVHDILYCMQVCEQMLDAELRAGKVHIITVSQFISGY